MRNKRVHVVPGKLGHGINNGINAMVGSLQQYRTRRCDRRNERRCQWRCRVFFLFVFFAFVFVRRVTLSYVCCGGLQHGDFQLNDWKDRFCIQQLQCFGKFGRARNLCVVPSIHMVRRGGYQLSICDLTWQCTFTGMCCTCAVLTLNDRLTKKGTNLTWTKKKDILSVLFHRAHKA